MGILLFLLKRLDDTVMTDLAPGVQVVCINDSMCSCKLCLHAPIYNNPLEQGRIYTVLSVRQNKSSNKSPLILQLIETEPPYHHRIGFGSRRFRPVRCTSIEVFEAIRVHHSAKEPIQ